MNINPKDFTEACQRFMRDPAVDAGIIEPVELPPPSPDVLEIMQGLAAGWEANESIKAIKALVKK